MNRYRSKFDTNYIDGEQVPPVSGVYLDNYCPSTGKVYSKIPSSDKRDVDAAVGAAKAAFPSWSATPAEDRAKYLFKIADLIEARLSEFAEAESLDQGKTVGTAMMVDIPRAVANFRYYAGHILHSEEMATHQQGPGVLNFTNRKPYGVIGLISPWNLPLYLATWKIAPAIAFGNTCVLKPSELSPATAHMLGDIFTKAKLPKGVVNIVHGLGKNCGQALVEHQDIKVISFTGGTSTGLHLAQTTAPFMKKLSLELGGKNANIIFEDADIEETVDATVRSSFANQGEICLCGSRILVQRRIYNAWLNAFVTKTRSLYIGAPSDPRSFMGALVSKQHLEKVLGYIELAKKEGGRIETGGDVPTTIPKANAGGYFLRPTIITELNPTARCCQEEIFGPVVTVMPFDTEEEAIQIANGVTYGLSASIWTKDGRRANRVALALDTGYVWINCWLIRDLRCPFGGTKASGLGREGGKYAEDFYTDVKTICSKL